MLLMEPEGPSILLILTTTADHQSLLFAGLEGNLFFTSFSAGLIAFWWPENNESVQLLTLHG